MEKVQQEVSEFHVRQERLRRENERLREKTQALAHVQEELEAIQVKERKMKKERDALINKYKETKLGRLQDVEELNRQIRVTSASFR